MLSQGEPRDATVNFDTYRILPRPVAEIDATRDRPTCRRACYVYHKSRRRRRRQDL